MTRKWDQMARNLMNWMLSVKLQQEMVFTGKSSLMKLEDTLSYKLIRGKICIKELIL